MNVALRLLLHSEIRQRDRNDTNCDTNLGAQLWTTMDGFAEMRPKFQTRKTTMDESGQRAECSTTAGCRFDSCSTCREFQGCRANCLTPSFHICPLFCPLIRAGGP